MTPSTLISAPRSEEMRQMAGRPRQSDGVGNALRQVFNGGAMLPPDLQSLVARLASVD